MWLRNSKLAPGFSNVVLSSSSQFPGADDLYCKYWFNYGQDWAVTSVGEGRGYRKGNGWKRMGRG
jgi:hypothetical protein